MEDPLPIEPLVLGEVVLLGDLLDELLLGELLEPELEPEPVLLLPEPEDVPPAAPLLEPDLSKYASHSEREICPSPFLSTDVKLGVDALPDEDDVPPADDDGVLDEDGVLDDLSLELLLPAADGDEVEGLLDDGLLDDEEDCATASVDRAKSTAAVVTVRVWRIWVSVVMGTSPAYSQALCPDRTRALMPRPAVSARPLGTPRDAQIIPALTLEMRKLLLLLDQPCASGAAQSPVTVSPPGQCR